ncbi:MAG: small multi-drug export protein [Desulfobulbaceae bacterium]|nr:small multi-drug export protein [Desulfobulbaceae bacterium]
MLKKNNQIRFLDTPEWLILRIGLLMSFFLAVGGWYFFASEAEMVLDLSMVFAAHTFGGRAAGIGLCIMNGYSYLLTIGYNFYLEILIVCLTYSVSILSIKNYIKLRAVRYYALRLERKAKKYKGKIEKYGWVGLFLFVMAPLPVTGPVVGSIIGYLLKFKVTKNFSATFLGTLTAIAVWTFFFDYLEQHLKVIRYILAAIIFLVLLSYAREIKVFFTKD